MRRLLPIVLVLAATALPSAQMAPAVYTGKDIASTLGAVNDLAFSPDSRLLAAGGARGYGVWDAQTGTEIRKSAGSAVHRVAVGGQGTVLALGDNDGRVTVVDLRTGMAREATRHKKPITALAFAADGRTGASGDTEGNIMLWSPDSGAIGALTDAGQKKEIFVLAFSGNTLVSVSKDLLVVTWDVAGKRSIRRGNLQSAVRGRVVVPHAGSLDPSGDTLVVAAQLVSEQRGGALAGRDAQARPSDLQRGNILMVYKVSNGISSDPVFTADYQGEHVVLGPGSCFAFFTSNYRDQPRLHVWGLIEQGDDLTRLDLPARASAIAVAAGGQLVATAAPSGQIRTWSVSGVTRADCDNYAKRSTPTSGPTITPGSETAPLIKAGAGVRLAVLRFEATGVEAGLGNAIAEMVSGELANNNQITVIERSAIDSVLKEMEIQRSGLTTADAVRIGKGLNARTVIFGSVRRFGESTYLVTARAVDVETQQVQGSREVTCENCREQDLPRAVAALRRMIVP